VKTPYFAVKLELYINGRIVNDLPSEFEVWHSVANDLGEGRLLWRSPRTDLLEVCSIAKDDLIEVKWGFREQAINTIFQGWIFDVSPTKTLVLQGTSASPAFRSTRITRSWSDIDPYTVINYTLEQAGITDFDLSGPALPKRDHFVANSDTIPALLAKIRKTWEIDWKWYFDLEGNFHFHPWANPGNKITRLEYAQNIVSLEPGEDVSKLLTIPMSHIWAGDVITIVHPQVGQGSFRVDTVNHYRRAGQNRTALFYREAA